MSGRGELAYRIGAIRLIWHQRQQFGQVCAGSSCPHVVSSLAASFMSTPLLTEYSRVKLGPRIIPFFRNIISQGITILRGVDNGMSIGLEPFSPLLIHTIAELFANAFAILDGLLSTIPTFWGSGEVTQVALLYIDQSSSDSKPMGAALTSLAKSLAKRAPAKVLLPTLLDMWQSLQSSRQMVKFLAPYSEFF